MISSSSRGVNYRRTYTLKEHEIFAVPAEDVLVDGELFLYPEVIHKNYFQIGFKGGELRIQSNAYVGLVPINDKIAIDVRPRVPIANLSYLLQITGRIPFYLPLHIKGYTLSDEPFPSLIDYLADAFIAELTVLGGQRRHFEYQRKNEANSLPRGRILLGQTLKNFLSRGNPHTVVTSVFSRVPDTALNRCLKYAVWYLAQCYLRLSQTTVIKQKLSELNKLFYIFRDVELDHSKKFVDHPYVSGSANLPDYYSHYKSSLSLATAIIQNRGVQLEGLGDEVSLGSLLLKLDDVFEDYVRIVLQRGIDSGKRLRQVLDGNLKAPAGGARYLFDDTTQTNATPDIVIVEKDEGVAESPVCRLVIDVKYKPLEKNPKREDLNQVITYAYSYKAPVAALIYPLADPSQDRIKFLGRIQETSFYMLAIDLSHIPVVEEEKAFCESINLLLDVIAS